MAKEEDPAVPVAEGEDVSDAEWETDHEGEGSDEAHPPPIKSALKSQSRLPQKGSATLPKQKKLRHTAPVGQKDPAAGGDEEDEEEEGDDDDVSGVAVATPAVSMENQAGYLAGDRGEAYRLPSDEDTDSSLDERGYRNRIGKVPLKWYEGYDHIGYDVEGNRLAKPTKSALQQLLEKVDDPEALRTVWDPVEHASHRLSDADLAILENIMSNRFPNPNYDPYPDAIEYVHWKPGENPFDRDRLKKSFTASRYERKIVSRLMQRIKRCVKRGKVFGPKPKTDPDAPHLLWDENIDDVDPAVRRRQKWHIPAPRMTLPSHAESYNPPPEFLPSKASRQRFNQTAVEERKRDFLPQKFDCLRHVPSYERFIEDRYQRCLDLFAATRSIVTRKIIKDPDQLLPKLPSPKDLRPYPCRLGFEYKGHQGPVRSLSCDPSGEWLATGGDDCVVRIFEVTSGKVVFAFRFPAPVTAVEWCPNTAFNLLACTAGHVLYLFVPRMCAPEPKTLETVKFLQAGKVYKEQELEEALAPEDIEEEELPPDEDDPEKAIHLCDWKDASPVEAGRDLLLKLPHHALLSSLTFHPKGDYVAVASPKDRNRRRQVVIHCLSKRQSLNPFRKLSDPALVVKFFPTEVSLFAVMTCRRISIYNLLEQRHVKKLRGSGAQMNCIDIHSGPENRNILAGSYERTTNWFDLDWKSRPYRRLKAHAAAVRAVAYHPRPGAYPLFASASDDGQVHVYHGTVFDDDLTKNALIIPLKILKGHKVVKYLGAQTCKFHPTLPWLFTGGGDGKVYLWIE